jgi:phosphate transport system protein
MPLMCTNRTTDAISAAVPSETANTTPAQKKALVPVNGLTCSGSTINIFYIAPQTQIPARCSTKREYMAEKFRIELQDLRRDSLEMAHLGRTMLRSAVDALIREDPELAESVIARQEEIHLSEIGLEEHCYHLIALYQPMAKDMRTIVCTLKIIHASLRIGRYGREIAKIVEEISDKPHTANLMSLPHMADLVTDMVDDAIRAFETDDLSLIVDFSSRDDTVDALRHSIFREGITSMTEDPKNISHNTYYIMVARYLERCGDHACSIAENLYYMKTGERKEIK